MQRRSITCQGTRYVLPHIEVILTVSRFELRAEDCLKRKVWEEDRVAFHPYIASSVNCGMQSDKLDCAMVEVIRLPSPA